MLITGRVPLGVGIGFGNQAVPLYLSEMAPAKVRGAVNQLFQLTTCLGILIANLINYGTEKIHPWGWRLSLGLATVPATVMFIGGLLCPETPNSLVEQNKMDVGRKVLERVRGTPNVDAEFEDLVDASREAQAIKNPFQNLLLRKNRPQFIIGRAFFLEAGAEMLWCMVATAVVLALEFGKGKDLSFGISIFLVIVIFLFVLVYGRSWGPLGWLVPSELFPLEIRSATQSVVVCVNMVFTALVAQLFLVSLCHLKYGIFLLFAGLVVLMSCFVFFLLPETKQVPIEEIYLLFEKHWFWQKIVADANQERSNGHI